MIRLDIPADQLETAGRLLERYALKGYPSGCWLWAGGTLGNGYGAMSLRRRPWGAHRVSWIYHNGTIPSPDLYVIHKCDTPSCVNPQHLSLGTQSDNMAEAKARGRVARGSGCPQSRLSAEQVLAIRESPLPGTELAAQYGVTGSTIHDIKHRRTWGWL